MSRTKSLLATAVLSLLLTGLATTTAAAADGTTGIGWDTAPTASAGDTGIGWDVAPAATAGDSGIGWDTAPTATVA
ncbi:hypothetical protein [Streptomyces sp. NBC_01244]|uniref:hypothetical protein n=1 Tax=Streptomyces sp. NBC_01244 TaxID=2903797 RepID=UPI002E15D657|nr:hypothetical protein OG247_41575 [Streptomyces sp. NBC_01244]